MDLLNKTRDLFFANLLGNGYYDSDAEIIKDGRNCEVEFTHSCYILASVRIEDWGAPFINDVRGEDANPRWDLFFILRNVFQDSFTTDFSDCHAANYLGRLVCIISFDSETEGWLDIFRDKAEKAIDILADQFDLNVVVAFSRTTDRVSKLWRCMVDADDVHEYIQVINEDLQVVHYDDLTEKGFPQPVDANFIELQTTLRACLRRFDTDGARLATSELISMEFYDSPPTIQVFRFRVYGLVNTLLFLLEDLRSLMGPEEYEKLNVGPRLTEVASLGQILSEVEGIYTQLDDYSQNRSNDNQPKWVPKIRDYIDSNYSDVNVTVSSTANHFSMTPSYCTRAFKRYIGISLFDYIQQRRIEAAKRLLAQNMNLSDVAETVGFSSPLTMNRAFKRYEGISPGKFKSV